MLRTIRRLCVARLGLSFALGVLACSPSASAAPSPRAAPNAEAQAVRAARAAQNAAIASRDADRVAAFWTQDVEIRRGLGTLVVGRAAYRQLFVPSDRPDADVVYQREPTTITISDAWPLAYESGTWVGRMGSVTGPVVIGGSYAAQWVKRDGNWLIRGEVFVALTCAEKGCDFVAVP
jgi:ketosteroid isomerase-like protein